MKKAAVGAASFIMALLIASCASNNAIDAEGNRVAIPKSLRETGMEAVESGNTVTIAFDANATTGYSWSYNIDYEGVVEEESSKYVEDKHAEEMVGYGGKQYYVFRGVDLGSVKATFRYHRPWDNKKGIYTVDVYFTVDDNRNIHITDIQ